MSNKTVQHLLQLILLRRAIRKRRLSNERSRHYDYVIINIFNLVTEYPAISIGQWVSAYGQLLKVSGNMPNTRIHLGVRQSFTAQSSH